VNGYGSAALKLLRGLYERAIALAYMVKEPAKTERFAHFAAIQEHKALKDGLRLTTEEHWNSIMSPGNAASEIRSRFEAVKEKFEQTDCKKCQTKRLAITWDLDVASMVAKVGDPYIQSYFLAYTNANLRSTQLWRLLCARTTRTATLDGSRGARRPTLRFLSPQY